MRVRRPPPAALRRRASLSLRSRQRATRSSHLGPESSPALTDQPRFEEVRDREIDIVATQQDVIADRLALDFRGQSRKHRERNSKRLKSEVPPPMSTTRR